MIPNGTKKKRNHIASRLVEKKNQHGTLGREDMWVFERTRCSDESKNKQTTRERERASLGRLRGGLCKTKDL